MNKIIDILHSQPRTIITLLLALIIGGVYSYVTIPKESNPDIDIPIFYVSVPQPGISAQDSERLILRPLENKLKGMDGLKQIQSIGAEDYGAVILEFDIKIDNEKTLADIRSKISEVESELPDEANEPKVVEINFALIPSIIVTVSGNVPERTLNKFANNLQDEIEELDSVLSADLSGARDEMVEVIINTSKLESYNLTAFELINAINQNNKVVSAGSVESENGKFSIKVPGLFKTIQDVYSIPIKRNGDITISLGELAEIKRTFTDQDDFSKFNGKQAISIEVVKRLGVNIIENNKSVRSVVDDYTKDWPDVIEVDYSFDQSTNIFEVLKSLEAAILTAVVLVMITVIAVLGVGPALLVGIGIPITFTISFLVINLLGMTVNIMVLFGLVLTVGMLVDGAIVIVEYAKKLTERGSPRRDAFLNSSKRMFWPIIASTGTTLAAFLPMLLWPGVAGQFMSYLPTMVIIVLSSALATALIFIPVIGSLWGNEENRIDYTTTDYEKTLYGKVVENVIMHPFIVLISALILGYIIMSSFIKFNNGVDYFVDQEPEEAVIFISARGNLSLYESKKMIEDVEAAILNVPGIENINTKSKIDSGGSPADQQDVPVDAIGQINIELLDFEKRRKAREIFDEIIENTQDIAGINVEIRKVEGGPPTGKNIRLEVTSANYENAFEATKFIRNYFDNNLQGIKDIEDTRPLPGVEWTVNVDREKAGIYDTDVSTIGSVIRLVTNGVLVGNFRPDDSEEEIEIRARLPKDERNIDQLDQLSIETQGGSIPISNITTKSYRDSVPNISKLNGKFAFVVKANTDYGVNTDQKVDEIEKWLADQKWSEDLKFKFRGADEEQKEAGDFLSKAAVAALALMFIILITQFNSFYQTFLTLFTVILSVFGVMLGILITGQTFSIIMTGTGIVALAGIVVNNAIVFIDTYNTNLRESRDPIRSVIQTSNERLRPILLTTITTIMGLIPMATQVTFDFIGRDVLVGGITSSWWVQMSTAIIFGLSFSTILTLVLLPTLLVMPYVIKNRKKLQAKNQEPLKPAQEI
ncbi:MAG: efflux RND transporter permease subunit [Hyphomicrobiales bacterium]|nr:transporter [Rhodobiaceae bacterium]OUT83405.1 MAG: transporter [Rhizobiales bacterium TMED28]RZO32770.1 MAG: efflux RND transporter permease subunit [Hyphomicrobiales bacterium]|tara:strand:+ start:2607 stop:5738 length:3132 start_codon:yes stop_codon:yes gene_type:complete